MPLDAKIFWAAVAAVVAVLVSGCSGGEGLSRAEVDEAITEALLDLNTEPGLTAEEVDRAIRDAIDELSLPAGGVQTAEAADSTQDPAQGDATGVPPRSDPAAYTRHVVDQAVALYDQDGLDAVLDHVNDPENVDGQWYVFVVDEHDTVIGHYEPDRRGPDLKGWVGTDLNGYVFGEQMLSATEAGRWVGYVYRNPAADPTGPDSAEPTGLDSEDGFELKIAWVVRRDGLLFGSGYHVTADSFIEEFTDSTAHRLRDTGAAATIEYFANPRNLGGGLSEVVEYYNRTQTSDGIWLGFFARSDRTVISSNNLATIGTDISELIGPAVSGATEHAAWITHDDNPEDIGPAQMRIRVVRQGDIIFGTGWYLP